MRPVLYMLKPSFPDAKAGPGLFFCPHSATIEGLLSYAPALRERLEIRVVDFPRPRHEIIAQIGEANQACPVLILPPGVAPPAAMPLAHREANGRVFFVGAQEIAAYLCAWASIPQWHP